jgi:hypothetical protein
MLLEYVGVYVNLITFSEYSFMAQMNPLIDPERTFPPKGYVGNHTGGH